MKTKPTEENVNEFLKESNAIEREYSNEAFDDAKQAWITGVLNAKDDFSIDLMLALHRRLMKRLNPKIAGHIREIPIYVGSYKSFRECLKPELIRERLKLLFKAWNDNKENLKEMPDSTKEAFIKQWHIDFESVHPFEDGNGRIGRMLMNLQRVMVGLPILIIHEGVEQTNYYKWFKGLNAEI